MRALPPLPCPPRTLARCPCPPAPWDCAWEPPIHLHLRCGRHRLGQLQRAGTPDSQLLRSKSGFEIVNPTSHPVPVTKYLSVPRHYETSQYLKFSQISKEISSSTGQYRPVPVLDFLKYLSKFENELWDAVRASSNLAVHVHVHVLNLVNSTARTIPTSRKFIYM